MQQAVSGITGALGGAVGGVMGPLTQLPQQAMQAGQGAMQPLMSALQQTYGAEGLDVADGARLVDSIEGEPGLGGEPGAGDVGAGGGGGGTTPTGYLGPPPVPTSSPPTTPAGAPAKSVTPDPVSGTPRASGPAGMTGMPMVPPGALGAGAEGANKDKPVEKRVTGCAEWSTGQGPLNSTAECSGEICRRQAGGHQVDATDPCCAERRQG
ncbi:hypothetical protein V3585_05850 [Mycobacterium tuberculosis]|nr:hypothetical protein [Mycobacterium tuberculosis]WIY13398.1 hypothetical protein QRF10_20520 [Mycobacterium tuberculosis]